MAAVARANLAMGASQYPTASEPTMKCWICSRPANAQSDERVRALSGVGITCEKCGYYWISNRIRQRFASVKDIVLQGAAKEAEACFESGGIPLLLAPSEVGAEQEREFLRFQVDESGILPIDVSSPLDGQ